MPYTLTENGMEFSMADGSVFKPEKTDEAPVLPDPGETEPNSAEPENNVQLWVGDYYGYWFLDSVWKGDRPEKGSYWDCYAALDLDENGKMIPFHHDDWYLPMVESGITEAPSGCVGE